MAKNDDVTLDQAGKTSSSVKPGAPGKPPQTPKPDPNHPLSHPPRGPGDPKPAEPNQGRNPGRSS